MLMWHTSPPNLTGVCRRSDVVGNGHNAFVPSSNFNSIPFFCIFQSNGLQWSLPFYFFLNSQPHTGAWTCQPLQGGYSCRFDRETLKCYLAASWLKNLVQFNCINHWFLQVNLWSHSKTTNFRWEESLIKIRNGPKNHSGQTLKKQKIEWWCLCARGWIDCRWARWTTTMLDNRWAQK